MGRLLHRLHLDALGEALFALNHLEITLDGSRREVEATGTVFLPCEPGEHTLEVALVGTLPGGHAMGRLLNASRAQVVVSAGATTAVAFVMSNLSSPVPGTNAQLEVR